MCLFTEELTKHLESAGGPGKSMPKGCFSFIKDTNLYSRLSNNYQKSLIVWEMTHVVKEINNRIVNLALKTPFLHWTYPGNLWEITFVLITSFGAKGPCQISQDRRLYNFLLKISIIQNTLKTDSTK